MKKFFKYLLPIAYCLLATAYCFGQPGSLSQSVYRSRVNDSTASISANVSPHTQGYADLYWNNEAVPAGWRMWDGTKYVDPLAQGGGGGITTANNGLTVNPAGNVQLGGSPLIQNTTIDGDGFFLQLGSGGSRLAALPINIVNGDVDFNMQGVGSTVNINGTNAMLGIGSLPTHKLQVTGTAANQNLVLIEEDAGADIFRIQETAANTLSTFSHTGTSGGLFVRPATNNQAAIFQVTDDALTPILNIGESSGQRIISGNADRFTFTNNNWNPIGVQFNLYDDGLDHSEFIISNGAPVVSIHPVNGMLIENYWSEIPLTVKNSNGQVRIVGGGGGIGLQNGDIWYDNTLNSLYTRNNGVNVALPGSGGGGITNSAAITEIPVTDDGSGNLAASGVFSAAAGNVTLGSASIAGDRTITTSGSATDVNLTISTQGVGTITSGDRHLFTATTTLPGINVGSFAGDPSSLTNGDIWYNSTSNNLRARINGASVSLGSGGGGITNTAAITEIPVTDDGSGNLAASGVFSAAAGNVTLGSASIAGNRTLAAVNSTSNADLSFTSQNDIYLNPSALTDLVIVQSQATPTFGRMNIGSLSGGMFIGAGGDAADITRLGGSTALHMLRLNCGNSTIQLHGNTTGFIGSNDLFIDRQSGTTTTLRVGRTTDSNFNTVFTLNGDLGGVNKIFSVDVGTNASTTITSNSAATITVDGAATTFTMDAAGMAINNDPIIELTGTSLNLIRGTGTTALWTTNGTTGTTSDISINTGEVTSGTSGNVLISSGQATGAGASGDIEIRVGTTVGGTPGMIQIDPNGGELIFDVSRTDCTGAPSGAIANIGGILNICP